MPVVDQPTAAAPAELEMAVPTVPEIAPLHVPMELAVTMVLAPAPAETPVSELVPEAVPLLAALAMAA